MEKRIEKAIDILLDAYNKGTLKPGDCTACAVGNLVRAGMNLTEEEYNIDSLRSDTHLGFINWSALFCTTFPYKQEVAKFPKSIMKNFPLIKKQIESTDFSVKELAAIEYALERGSKGRKSRVLDGLTAVIEVMKSFNPEQNQDLDVQKCFDDRVKIIDPEVSLCNL